MAVVGAAFLLAMDGALGRVHVEHDGLGPVAGLGLADQLAVDRHQPDQVLVAGEHAGLEALQSGGQRCAAIPVPLRADQAKRWVGGDAHGIVEILVARQPRVDRLPHQIRQRELGVLALPRVDEKLVDELAQTEPLVQFTAQQQPAVGGDPRALEIDLQKTVERELKRLAIFVTHSVSPSVAHTMRSNPHLQGRPERCDD